MSPYFPIPFFTVPYRSSLRWLPSIHGLKPAPSTASVNMMALVAQFPQFLVFCTRLVMTLGELSHVISHPTTASADRARVDSPHGDPRLVLGTDFHSRDTSKHYQQSSVKCLYKTGLHGMFPATLVWEAQAPVIRKCAELNPQRATNQPIAPTVIHTSKVLWVSKSSSVSKWLRL